jgi:tRNA C32,U32 (ribose-2'-O)-methylase TrmJ
MTNPLELMKLLKKSKTKYIPTSKEGKFVSEVMETVMANPALQQDDIETLTGIFNQLDKIIDSSEGAQKFVHQLILDIKVKPYEVVEPKENHETP